MTDLQLIFLLFVVFYLFECILWVKTGSIVFNSMFGTSWSIRFPEALFGNQNGGLWLINPFPPLGYTFICQLLPLSLSPTHLTTYLTNNISNNFNEQENHKTFNFDNIESIKVENKQIIINDSMKIKTNNTQLAKNLFDFISFNKNLTIKERKKNIENAILDSMSTEKIGELWKEYKKKSVFLRILCNTVWIYIFAVVPIVIITRGFLTSLFNLLLFYLILHFATIMIYYFTANTLKNKTNSYDIYINILKMILYPPSVIRALDLVTINLFNGYHPLAVIYVLDSSKEQFILFARKLLLDLKYPLKSDIKSKDTIKTIDWYRKTQLKIYSYFLADKDFNIKHLLIPEIDGNFKTYCPRCLTKYVIAEGTCSECKEINLISTANIKDNKK